MKIFECTGQEICEYTLMVISDNKLRIIWNTGDILIFNDAELI